MYIATFGRSVVVLRTINTNPAGANMDVGAEAMHTGMYALLRWQMYRIPFSEFLEQLASDNGADMHKYNTIYTRIF